jgi:hypothetical protein
MVGRSACGEAVTRITCDARRLFEALEERVRRLLRHLVGVVDHEGPGASSKDPTRSAMASRTWSILMTWAASDQEEIG